MDEKVLYKDCHCFLPIESVSLPYKAVGLSFAPMTAEGGTILGPTVPNGKKTHRELGGVECHRGGSYVVKNALVKWLTVNAQAAGRGNRHDGMCVEVSQMADSSKQGAYRIASLT